MIIVWLMLAGIGGTAAILGSLMGVASLALWAIAGDWKNKLKLLGFSIGCAIAGFLVLQLIPFPFQ